MIAVDTNILVYAHRADSPWHTRAAELVRGLAEGSDGWAIPWPCIHEFLSIVTHPRIYKPPSPLEVATEQVAAWIESPALTLLGESPVHWQALRKVIEAGQVVGPKVHDARVAALCSQHGVRELWSADRDFSGMSSLRDPEVWRAAHVRRGVVAWGEEYDLAPEFLYARAQQLDPPGAGEDVDANQLTVTMRELRAFAGRSQVEVAEAMGVAQTEISRLEGRADTKLSTIERYVRALGGEVEVVARFGDRSLRLHIG